MKRLLLVVTILLAFLSAPACSEQDAAEKIPEAAKPEPAAEKTPDKSEPVRSVSEVDVPLLANKGVSEFDEIFGEAVKVTKITDRPDLMPGEYREYRVAGHPKGLSVRFYKDSAKRFNLLLGKPESSSEEALLDIFKIDVKKLKRTAGDPLSETWKGRLGKLNFETAYAKRGKSGGDFVMLHAEVSKQ
ncbi:MAG: hypothetical protein R2681_11450 [Pyrinomonadaceae bacterium]